MKKILLAIVAIATLSCNKKDDEPTGPAPIRASDYHLSSDGLTLEEWSNPTTVSIDMEADPNLKKVKIIGVGAFRGHKNLGAITLPKGLTNIKGEAFVNTKLNSIVIPQGVQVIEERAFFQSKLTSVEFSEGLITIGNSAFMHCNIPVLHFPESLEAIGVRAFSGNSVVVSVTIPKNVKDIGAFAFHQNAKMVTATFKGTIPPRISSIIFNQGEGELSHIYVPKGSLTAYRNAPNFDSYKEKIVEEP
jgi:hypothetical protein